MAGVAAAAILVLTAAGITSRQTQLGLDRGDVAGDAGSPDRSSVAQRSVSGQVPRQGTATLSPTTTSGADGPAVPTAVGIPESLTAAATGPGTGAGDGAPARAAPPEAPSVVDPAEVYDDPDDGLEDDRHDDPDDNSGSGSDHDNSGSGSGDDNSGPGSW